MLIEHPRTLSCVDARDEYCADWRTQCGLDSKRVALIQHDKLNNSSRSTILTLEGRSDHLHMTWNRRGILQIVCGFALYDKVFYPMSRVCDIYPSCPWLVKLCDHVVFHYMRFGFVMTCDNPTSFCFSSARRMPSESCALDFRQGHFLFFSKVTCWSARQDCVWSPWLCRLTVSKAQNSLLQTFLLPSHSVCADFHIVIVFPFGTFCRWNGSLRVS